MVNLALGAPSPSQPNQFSMPISTNILTTSPCSVPTLLCTFPSFVLPYFVFVLCWVVSKACELHNAHSSQCRYNLRWLCGDDTHIRASPGTFAYNSTVRRMVYYQFTSGSGFQSKEWQTASIPACFAQASAQCRWNHLKLRAAAICASSLAPESSPGLIVWRRSWLGGSPVEFPFPTAPSPFGLYTNEHVFLFRICYNLCFVLWALWPSKSCFRNAWTIVRSFGVCFLPVRLWEAHLDLHGLWGLSRRQQASCRA